MKFSSFILSVGGFWIVYICYAEWIDDWYERFVEKYFGSETEEVPPFVSSLTSGTTEFDNLVKKIVEAKKKSSFNIYTLFLVVFASIGVVVLMHTSILKTGKKVLKKGRDIAVYCCRSVPQVKNDDDIVQNKEEIQTLVTEVLEKHLKSLCSGKVTEDIPVELLWKGSAIVESSMHCNLKEDLENKIPKLCNQSKLVPKPSGIGAGDELEENITPSSSEESTMRKMAEIRKLLESEPEIIQRFVDKCAGTDDVSQEMITELRQRLTSEISLDRGRNLSKNYDKDKFISKTGIPTNLSDPWKINLGKKKLNPDTNKLYEDYETPEVADEKEGIRPNYLSRCDRDSSRDKISSDEIASLTNFANETEIPKSMTDANDGEIEGSPDPKLMNRIRLLESRLRLEELKNRNWINRMSRAEGILQQLNKQVERGIDSMSKGANTSLPPSGGADRRDSPGGDADRNIEDYQHSNQLDAVDATQEESAIYTSEPVPFLLLATAVHVAD